MDLNEFYALSQHFLAIKYQEYHRKVLSQNLFQHPLSIILGQRGVGKTTLIIQYLRQQVERLDSPQILYVPADHFLLGQASLYEIAEKFEHWGGKWIAFDEIHQYPQWSKELKSIADTFPNLQVIASGSSALAIHQGTHDLSRRAIVHEVFGFSFREYLELKWGFTLPCLPLEDILQNAFSLSHLIGEQLATKQKKVLPEFHAYLQAGYYPYALEMADPRLYWMTLEQNIHTTLDSDLCAIFPALTGASIRKMKQLLSFIASNVPFVPNLQKLKQVLQIGDERTLKNYLNYLEDARLIRQLQAASSKFKQLEVPEKIYLDNPNLLYAISQPHPNTGTVRELFFLTMLSLSHQVTAPKQGDFLVDDQYLFEIGGKNKKVLADAKAFYLACDDMEKPQGNKIPLWLFGFLD